MHPPTANENNEPSTKRQKTSEDSNSNEISSIIEASTDEQVAGPSNVHKGNSGVDSDESAVTATVVKNDTLNSNIDEDDAVDESNIDAPNADASTEEQTAAILKLDIDCFEEAFDYLWFQELIAVGKACKRLQQVAGYFLHQNYGANIKYAYPQTICTELAYFIPFIREIAINNINELEYFLQSQSKYHRLKQMKMRRLDFTKVEIGRLLKMAIWSKLEVLCIERCTLNNNFKEILNLCTKLRQLEIVECGGVQNWFDRKYPTLEYLKFDHERRESSIGIPRFLELNPNIRKFVTDYSLLWENRDKMLTANIKLDDLAIDFRLEVESKFQSMCDLLNELHDRGFYIKLQLYTWAVLQQEQFNQLDSVKGLNKLQVASQNYSISLSNLKNVQEIYLPYDFLVADLEMLPNNLINLKRIHFTFASIDAILPFIRQSFEMQRIKVEVLSAGAHYNKDTKVIDLRALNRERKELSGAAKITLYVDERIYLATKWAFGETDFELIRLRRDTSFEWRHDF